MAGSLPMLDMAHGIGGAVATTAASGAIAGAVDVGSSLKAKANVTLEYSLTRVDGGDPVLKQISCATASQDGEDVISPLVCQAAADTARKTAANPERPTANLRAAL